LKTQQSFWEYSEWLAPSDVIVVGSGIVGLTAALILKEREPALKVTVVERGALPSGASTRNAGFACFGSISELIDDLERSSEQEVFALAEKRLLGLVRLRERLGDENIEFENWGGYDVFNQEEQFMACADQISFFNRQLKTITGLEQTYSIEDQEIPRFGFAGVQHLIINRGEGQINTGRMMVALLDKVQHVGVKILTGLDIINYQEEEKGIVLDTSMGYQLQTRQLLVCTNGFARQLLPNLDVEPARAQVLITEPIRNLSIRGAFHYDKGYYYFRNVGNRILLGGGRNLDFKGETTTEHNLTDLIQNRLDQLLYNMILPGVNYTIDMRWAGTMGLGKRKQPIIESITSAVSCAVRMGGMGIALGSLTGEEAAELVLKKLQNT
jgi:hypothetical protein